MLTPQVPVGRRYPQLLQACLYAASFALARSRARDIVHSDRTCSGSFLLQLDTTRSQQVASLQSTAPSCPAEGAQCTLIIVYKDGVKGASIVEAYKGDAEISHLSAIGEDILDFGKHHREACCNAYKRLQEASGVESVEFDAPVHAITKTSTGSLATAADSEATHEVFSSHTAEGCPEHGKQCTILVSLKDGEHRPNLVESYKNQSDILHLSGDGTDILDFGEHRPVECCNAFKQLRATVGVGAVEFDMRARAIDKSRYGALTVVNSSTRDPCPAAGKNCTLIVVLDEGVNGTDIATPYSDRASLHYLNAIGQVTLEFGDQQADECCSAYKSMKDQAGVKDVEFDAPVHAYTDEPDGVERSAAMLTNSLFATTLIFVLALNVLSDA